MKRPDRKSFLTNPLFKRAYSAWSKAKQRCNDPKNNRYHLYGAKGITFCERWKSFDNFLIDMGLPETAKHSIDRIDNSGNYEPGNCRWATHLEQSMNKTTNRILTINGQSKTLAEWGRISGLGMKLIWSRLDKGWPENEKLLSPIRDHKPMELIQLENGATLSKLSKETGLRYHTLYGRYMRGLRGAELTKPTN